MSLVRICANKRYAAIDKLVNEIKLEDGQGSRTVLEDRSPEDFSAELLCKFWNILKANPRFDLEGTIEDRLKACPLNDAVCSMAVCSCGKHTHYVCTKRCTQHILSRACRDMMSEMGTHGQQITNMRCEISHRFKSGCPGVSTETSESELSKRDVSQKSSPYLSETCKLTENASTSHQSCEEACKPFPEVKKPRPHYCGIGIAPTTSRQSGRVACEPAPESLDNTKTPRSSRSDCCQQDRKKPKPHNCGIGIVQKKISYRSCRDTSETINKEYNNNCNTVLCQQEPEKPTPHYCGIGKIPKNWYYACGEANGTISEGQSLQCDTKFKTDLNQSDSLQLTPHCCKIGASAKMSHQSFGQAEPLTVAIREINMAQIQDSNCAWRLNDLMKAEERIRNYMHRLEAKELLGIAQLQQADEMWASMEEAYLKALRESEEKQQIMLCQEKELRENLSKWRKKEKNREKNALKVEAKAYKIEQAREKEKQLEKLTNECDCLRQRIETTKKELDQVHTNINKNIKKKQDKIEAEISALEKKIALEKLTRQMKEHQGRGTVRGARDHFAAACRVLLQTQLDRESLYAEEEVLNLEMDLMNEAIMNCKEKCQLKLKPLRDEIIAVEEDITRNNLKCVRCNACVSTSDIKKRCTDCKRCLKGTCQYKDKTCSSDDCGCVCPEVKEKFLANILDNMYNILEPDMKRKKSHLALDVIKCMKQSKSGKLDAATREKIHVYVMKTVGKHLDAISTEAGIKTKSEIDPKQLAQLRLCLKEVIVGPLQEKGVRRKKSVATTSADRAKDTQRTILNMAQMTPCKRRNGGGGSGTLCNCPEGPDSCVCANRVPAAGVSASVASCSSVLKKTSLSTPKARSCSSATRKFTAEASKASRVSIVTPPKVRSSTVHSRRSSSVSVPGARNNVSTSNASIRTVRGSTRSACACTASAKGPCRCIRSTKSRSSMNSKSSCSNVEYTAKVRDKLIKEVTNVAQPRSSTQMTSYSHYSGSCTCIEEKELKLHRPSSRASRTSGPAGLKNTFSQQSQKKSSTTVCNPPSNPTGTAFMRRFSAASSRQESDKEVRKTITDNLEKLSKSEATRGGVSGLSSCLDWICCKKKGKTSGSVNEMGSGKGGIDGAGGVLGGVGGAVGLERAGAAGGAGMGAGANNGAGVVVDAGANGNAGVNTGGSASADAGANRSAGAHANTGVRTGESASADAGANESAGAGRGGGASADADRSAGVEGRAGANAVGGAEDTESATRRQSQVASTAGADVERETDGGKAAGGGKGAGATHGSGTFGGPGGAGGGSGTFAGTGGTLTEGPGSFRGNKLEQSTDSKQPAAMGKVNLLSSSVLPNPQGRADRTGADASDVSNGNENLNTSDLGDSYSGSDSPIRKRTREKVKPSPELSMLYCDPEDCSETCDQTRRESLLPSVQKESSANTHNKDNLADDPCYRSYRRRLKKALNHQGDRICKQKRRNCGQNHPTTENPTGGIQRSSYKKTVIEPQLPGFLRRHQLPRSSFN